MKQTLLNGLLANRWDSGGAENTAEAWARSQENSLLALSEVTHDRALQRTHTRRCVSQATQTCRPRELLFLLETLSPFVF